MCSVAFVLVGFVVRARAEGQESISPLANTFADGRVNGQPNSMVMANDNLVDILVTFLFNQPLVARRLHKRQHQVCPKCFAHSVCKRSRSSLVCSPNTRRLSAIASNSCVGNGVFLFINLARREDRVKKLAETFVSSPSLWQRLQRIDAVDGQNLSLDDEAGLAPYITRDALDLARVANSRGLPTVVHHRGDCISFHNYFTRGAVACAMSHHKALQAVADHPTASWAVILEDDIAAAVPEADLVVERLLSKLPPDWDAVWLGYHHDDGQLTSKHSDGDSVPVRPLTEDYHTGLFAWAVRKEAAKIILEKAFPLAGQVDCAISNFVVKAGLRAFIVEPHHFLFHSLKSEQSMDSDIQNLVEVSDEEAKDIAMRKIVQLCLRLRSPNPDADQGSAFRHPCPEPPQAE